MSFIHKLFELVQAEGRHVRWSPDGESFNVANLDEFSTNVLPNYFKHANYSSFVRQLNLYNFVRSTRKDRLYFPDSFGSDMETFHHPYFKRDRFDLLPNIRRRIVTSHRTKNRQRPDTPASFQSMTTPEAILNGSAPGLPTTTTTATTNILNPLSRFSPGHPARYSPYPSSSQQHSVSNPAHAVRDTTSEESEENQSNCGDVQVYDSTSADLQARYCGLKAYCKMLQKQVSEMRTRERQYLLQLQSQSSMTSTLLGQSSSGTLTTGFSQPAVSASPTNLAPNFPLPQLATVPSCLLLPAPQASQLPSPLTTPFGTSSKAVHQFPQRIEVPSGRPLQSLGASFPSSLEAYSPPRTRIGSPHSSPMTQHSSFDSAVSVSPSTTRIQDHEAAGLLLCVSDEKNAVMLSMLAAQIAARVSGVV